MEVYFMTQNELINLLKDFETRLADLRRSL